MNNRFFKGVETALAVERLDAFRQDGASPAITLSRYLWNMALCESLYSPLQIAEVALRNAVHTCLSDRFSANDWYTTPGLLLGWQMDWVDKATRKLSNRKIPVLPSEVVVELHFGFWTGFFNKAHEDKGIAHFLVKPVFRHAPKHERVASKLGIRWNRVRSLRNRVFHHERILHWEDLSDQHATMIQTIGWISPELREMAEALDRFTPIHSAGIDPWKEKIQNYWPIDIESKNERS